MGAPHEYPTQRISMRAKELPTDVSPYSNTLKGTLAVSLAMTKMSKKNENVCEVSRAYFKKM